MVLNINKNLRNLESYSKMNQFDAVGIAEGWIEPESQQETLVAWQILVDTELVWTLQGMFGRAAHDLLELGLIDKANKRAYTKSRYEKNESD